MLNKRFKLNYLTFLGLLSLFLFAALIPNQAQAMNMSYNGWELDGFFRNTTAAWMESFDYAPDQDSLAMCRTMFRLNLNGKISNSLRLKAEVLAAYEPEYDREENGGIDANEYNYFNFRELRLDWRPAMGHNIRFGRQIVNWGEALTGRVGDVVNSTDARWDLGFTNLEDTYIPTWMIRGIHQFYNMNLTIDWIFAPYLEDSDWRHSRTLAHNANMMVANGAGGVMYTGVGTERFSLYPETRLIIPGFENLINLNTVPLGSPILFPSMQQAIYSPLSSGFNELILTNQSSAMKDARYGFKTSSTIFGAQTGIYIFRTHFSAWGTTTLRYEPSTGNMYSEWNRITHYGFYANKNFDFGVLRMDVNYAPDYKVSVLDLAEYPTLVSEIDRLKIQFGYNRDFMIRPLNEFQAFSLTAEYIGEYIVGGEAKGDALYSWVSHCEMPDASHQLAVSFSTNYNFGMYQPGITLILDDEGCGLAQAKLTYNPDWMNRKWSFTLQYTNIFANDQYDFVYGLLEEKDMIGLQTQFSFP